MNLERNSVSNAGGRSRLRRAYPAVAALALGAFAASLPAQVPGVVATSPVSLNSTVTGGPVVTDSCGNVYEYGQDGSTGIIQIAAGTGNVTTIVKNTNGYASGPGLAIDAAKKNLYFPDFTNYYTNHFDQVPIVNCQPGAVNNAFPSDLGSLGVYYIGSIGSGGGDANGDLFFVPSGAYTNDIFEEVYTASTATYKSAMVLPNWANQILYVTSDAAGDVYFADKTSSSGSNNIYVLKVGYTAAPSLVASGFNNIAGLSFDPAGNLYVTDAGSGKTPGVSAIYEIPVVSGSLNAADLFAIAEVPLVGMVAVDGSKNIYLANYSSGSEILKTGSAIAPAVALGSKSSATINYVFNAATTPTALSAVTGTATSPTFSIGTTATGGCATGTTYSALVPAVAPTSPLPTTSCTVTATYTPSAVGEQTGAVLFAGASSTHTTYVSGIGQAAAATIDPGTVALAATKLTAPYGVTVDNMGNVWVTDSTANTLTEFAVGSAGVGTTISTGTLALSGPTGVAVDNIGNVFVADTGNSRIVEIPVSGGKLVPANATALSLTLKNPQGVATDGTGNLYIADTGDNLLWVVPNIGGSLNVASAASHGTGLKGPSAVTIDLNGNAYVAEATGNDVIEFPVPVGNSQVKVVVGLNSPTAISTDASGSLFVAQGGSIQLYPNVAGSFGAPTQAGSSVLAPTGVAVDANGNLYYTDTTNDVTGEIQRVASALQFGAWNVGTSSTPLSATVSSSGNEPLIFKTPSYTASGATTAGFAVTTDGCAGSTQQPGNTCSFLAGFTPTASEQNAQENLTLASNAGNGSPVLELVGTGTIVVPTTLSLTLTNPAGASTLTAGQSVTFTATIADGGVTPVPTGSIQFSVNGTSQGTVQVTNGAASLTLANGLPYGSAVAISASYSGESNPPTYYSGSTVQITENVVALTDTTSVAITSPWTNPQSANDAPANPTGPSIPLTATVTTTSSTIPTGTVTFFAGSTSLGIAQLGPTSTGTYVATLATTALRAGTTTQVEDGSFVTTYGITAVYSGDTKYASSTAASVPISIVAGPATASLPPCAGLPPNETATASGGAPTCYTNTTGAFFTLTPANPTITAATSKIGGPGSGSTTMTITSYGGWNGALNFTCSGLPQYATCAPYPGFPNGIPSSVAKPATPATFSFIINTNVAPTPPNASSTVWWISGLAGLAMLMLRRRIKRLGYLKAGQLVTIVGGVLFLAGSAIGMSGCGGTQSYAYITPAGTSTVTVKVSAAQLNLSSNAVAGATYLPDVDTPTFTINLVVQ
jgi:sugar lactone lactonase YvrE